MVHRILFPTDFSDAANHAFPAALHLASHFGAEIITLHAYVEPHVPKGYLTRTLKEIVDSVGFEEFEYYRDQLPRLHEIAASLNYGDVPIRHALCPGQEIAGQILLAAKKEAGDLIVMGTTGARGLEEFFQSTVAAEVMENAPCPVLVVPQSAVVYPKFSRIAFATGLDESEKNALGWLEKFGEHLHAKIVKINLPMMKAPVFEAYVVDAPDPEEFIFCDCWASETSMTEFLISKEIDVLALTTHRTSFIRELFRQNFEKHIVRHLPYPILGIPEKEQP